MTTIVIDRKNRCILQNSHSLFYKQRAEKPPVIHVPGRGLFAMTGDLSYSEVKSISDWILDPDIEKPDIKLGENQVFNIACLLRDGEARCYFYDLTWTPQTGDVFSYGSGGIVAATALYCGKNPYDAVRAATELDPDSHGFPVVWHIDRGQITGYEYISLIT